MLLGIGSFIVLAVPIGFGFETFMRSQASRKYPVLGQLVDIGGRKIQIDCRGQGSPTVVLESGIDILGSLNWAAVHAAILIMRFQLESGGRSNSSPWIIKVRR
jgi:hypothetical protein